MRAWAEEGHSGKRTPVANAAETISYSCGKNEIGFLSPAINKSHWWKTAWGSCLQPPWVGERRGASRVQHERLVQRSALTSRTLSSRKNTERRKAHHKVGGAVSADPPARVRGSASAHSGGTSEGGTSLGGHVGPREPPARPCGPGLQGGCGQSWGAWGGQGRGAGTLGNNGAFSPGTWRSAPC